MVVWSLGSLVLLGEPFAVVADLADARDRGRYLAAYGVSWGLATTVAPIVATTLPRPSAPRVRCGSAAPSSPPPWRWCRTGVGAVVTQQ